MASKTLLLLLALVAVVLPPAAMATEFIVGDDKGWAPGVNYTQWATGKMFMAGDTLVFNYPVDKHNVIKVAGADFKACKAPANAAPLTSGKDVIPLAAPGKKWYICGVKNHCSLGQKLVINVLPMMSQAPAAPPSTPTAPPSPTTGKAPKALYPSVLLAVLMAVVMRVFY